MKKVYLLTFHGSVNYGAVLQGYALAKTIQDMGYECQIIDYNRKTHHKNYLQIKSDNFKVIVYSMIHFPNKYILNKRFNTFAKNNLIMTKESYDGFGALNNFKFEKDAIFLIGSDQVWNCKLTENNYHYFLDFVDTNLKYSYAASFGISDISNWNNKNKVSELLKQFKKISVREESGQKILEKEFNIDSKVVCDPTFLLNSKQWDCIIKKEYRKKYILLFMLTYNQTLVDRALEVSVEKNIPIINIAYTVRHIPGIKSVKNLSPNEWLAYIKGAEYVFTNSFHGFALSLNFQRQVWVALTQGNRNSRILDLASRYGIIDRVISDGSMELSPINYSKLTEVMEQDRLRSRKILEEMLNGKSAEQ